MARVKLVLDDKGQWTNLFDPQECTITVSLSDPPQIGESLRVDLGICEVGPRVILRGRVISRQGPDGAENGCTIALGPEEREKVNYLNGFVRGGLLNLREKRRIPVRLPCTYGGASGPCESYTRDINEEGMFLVSPSPLPEATEIHLRVTMPTEPEPIELVGVVVHTVVVDDEDVPGMGIVFRFEPGKDKEFLARVDRLEESFLTGALPDSVLQ